MERCEIKTSILRYLKEVQFADPRKVSNNLKLDYEAVKEIMAEFEDLGFLKTIAKGYGGEHGTYQIQTPGRVYITQTDFCKEEKEKLAEAQRLERREKLETEELKSSIEVNKQNIFATNENMKINRWMLWINILLGVINIIGVAFQYFND